MASKFLANAAAAFFCGAFFYALLGMLGGEVFLLSAEGLRLVSEHSWFGAALLVFCAAALYLFLKRFSGKEWRINSYVLLLAALGGYLVFLFGDVAVRGFGFYQNPSARADLIWCGLLALFALMLYRRAGSRGDELLHERVFTRPLLLFVQILVFVLFMRYADGRLIFSDDHPSFLYRLHLLREHFPWIPFYNDDWNAGYSAREFFPSGVLNVFFVSWPLLYLAGDLSNFGNAQVYTLIIPFIFVLLVPWCIYASARLFGCSRSASVLAGIFALGPSMGFFEWLLKYGTMGFSFSIGLVPLTIALAQRLALGEKPVRALNIAALLVVSFLCLCWTLSACALLPVLVLSLIRFRTTFSKGRRAKIICFAVLFLVLNGPWMLTFVEESKVLSFLSEDTLPGSTVKDIEAGRRASLVEGNAARPLPLTAVEDKGTFSDAWKHLKKARNRFREYALKVNPLLLFFFLPGVLLIRNKTSRMVLGLSLLWLLAVSVLGDFIKPQLELRRMILPASYLMAILSGVALVEFCRLLEQSRESGSGPVRRTLAGGALVFVLGALILSPLTVAAAYLNRTDERFIFAPEMTSSLSAAIKQYGGNGRTFFLGFLLQELGASHWSMQNGGHVAPLAAFSGKPLYAFDYYHYRWSTVDPIPESYRKRGPAGIEEFLDLVNTTAVVTFKREWADYCLRTPRYRQVYQGGRFRVFVREGASGSYFQKGDGEVRRAKEGFYVTPSTNESVLKFRYLPKLRVFGVEGAEIYPVEVFEEEVGGGKKEQVFFVGLRVPDSALGREMHVGYWER